jgi:hypothetical protein
MQELFLLSSLPFQAAFSTFNWHTSTPSNTGTSLHPPGTHRATVKSILSHQYDVWPVQSSPLSENDFSEWHARFPLMQWGY